MNLSTYLKEIQKEMKLTTWPKQEVVISFTLFVIIFTAVMAVYLGALDLGFGEAVLKGINKVSTPVITDVNAVISTTTEATSTPIFNSTTTNQ